MLDGGTVLIKLVRFSSCRQPTPTTESRRHRRRAPPGDLVLCKIVEKLLPYRNETQLITDRVNHE